MSLEASIQCTTVESDDATAAAAFLWLSTSVSSLLGARDSLSTFGSLLVACRAQAQRRPAAPPLLLLSILRFTRALCAHPDLGPCLQQGYSFKFQDYVNALLAEGAAWPPAVDARRLRVLATLAGLGAQIAPPAPRLAAAAAASLARYMGHAPLAVPPHAEDVADAIHAAVWLLSAAPWRQPQVGGGAARGGSLDWSSALADAMVRAGPGGEAVRWALAAMPPGTSSWPLDVLVPQLAALPRVGAALACALAAPPAQRVLLAALAAPDDLAACGAVRLWQALVEVGGHALLEEVGGEGVGGRPGGAAPGVAAAAASAEAFAGSHSAAGPATDRIGDGDDDLWYTAVIPPGVQVSPLDFLARAMVACVGERPSAHPAPRAAALAAWSSLVRLLAPALASAAGGGRGGKGDAAPPPLPAAALLRMLLTAPELLRGAADHPRLHATYEATLERCRMLLTSAGVPHRWLQPSGAVGEERAAARE